MENNDELPITVVHNDDNTFTIDWDEEDPRTCQFNLWTEEDFHNAIRKGLEEELLEKEERACRTDFTTEEFIDNFDELFARVEDGETLSILHETGQRVLIMPINQLPDV